MKEFLLYLWQLPQNILGLLVVYFTRAIKLKTVYLVPNPYFGGVSLGKYIIVSDGQDTSNIILHEKGHQKQSLYFGPLYLLFIGLPSIIGNLIYRIKPFNYYKQPWEKWADKLGGVNRKEN